MCFLVYTILMYIWIFWKSSIKEGSTIHTTTYISVLRDNNNHSDIQEWSSIRSRGAGSGRVWPYRSLPVIALDTPFTVSLSRDKLSYYQHDCNCNQSNQPFFNPNSFRPVYGVLSPVSITVYRPSSKIVPSRMDAINIISLHPCTRSG